MSGRFFLDSNIFVYAFDTTAPTKAARAAELIRSSLTTRSGVISYQVVQEFFSVALRRFPKPMSQAEAEQFLATTLRPLLAVQSSTALYGEALRLGTRFQLNWYDALIVASAMEAKCELLYSEDFQNGMRMGNLMITDPFA